MEDVWENYYRDSGILTIENKDIEHIKSATETKFLYTLLRPQFIA